MTTKKILSTAKALDELFSNKDEIKKIHQEYEEKFQVLLHELQNGLYPKNPKRFIEEIRRIRNERWIYGQLSLIINNPQFQGMFKQIQHIHNPRERKPNYQVEGLQEYIEKIKKF